MVDFFALSHPEASWADKCRDLLFPPKCVGCGELLDGKGAFCGKCEAQFREHLELKCPECLLPFSECVCANPFMRRSGVSKLYKVFAYLPDHEEISPSRLLYSLKQNHVYYAVDLAARLLAARIEQADLDARAFCVAYIPASLDRLRQNGADPMKTLAARLCRLTGADLISPLRRVGLHTPSQKSLRREERLSNAYLLYQTKRGVDLHGAKVLLLDDICTTGATLCASVAALRRAGATRVVCMTLAKTVQR